MENINTFKVSLVAFFGALSAVLGWFGWLVVIFIGTMVIDYFTGSAAAGKNGEWSSKRAREGLWHKCGSLIAVIVAGLADIVLGLIVNNIPAIVFPWEYTVLFCPIVVVWYIITELGSIIENVGELGAPIPSFLRNMIKALKAAADTAGNQLIPGEDSETDKTE